MCTDRESCVNIERIFCCPCFFIVWFSCKYHFINHRKYNSCYERITYSMADSGNNSLYMCLVNNKKDCIFLCTVHCSPFIYIVQDHVCNNITQNYLFHYKEKTIQPCKNCLLYYLRNRYSNFQHVYF